LATPEHLANPVVGIVGQRRSRPTPTHRWPGLKA
jgi:hypothetical protein